MGIVLVHCALCIVPAKCAEENVWEPTTGNGLQDLGSATGNGLWATATGNGLRVTATGNGDPEAALLKHEGRPREATGGHDGDGNWQPRFWAVNS